MIKLEKKTNEGAVAYNNAKLDGVTSTVH